MQKVNRIACIVWQIAIRNRKFLRQCCAAFSFLGWIVQRAVSLLFTFHVSCSAKLSQLKISLETPPKVCVHFLVVVHAEMKTENRNFSSQSMLKAKPTHVEFLLFAYILSRSVWTVTSRQRTEVETRTLLLHFMVMALDIMENTTRQSFDASSNVDFFFFIEKSFAVANVNVYIKRNIVNWFMIMIHNLYVYTAKN